MKQISILLMTTVFLCSFGTQQTDYALGRANKTNNKIVFYENEPTTEYEQAFTFKNLINDKNNCNTPQENIDQSIKNANKEAADQGTYYDAIIMGTTERDIAIKFKDKSKDNAIARVKKIEGKYVFIECEPVANYNISEKYEVAGLGTALLTGKCPTIKEKVSKLLDKATKKKVDYDAIVFGSDKNKLIVKFK